MSDGGFLVIPRSFFEQSWNSPREFSEQEAMIDIIQEARYSDGEALYNEKRIPLRRGQLLGALGLLQQRWRWTSRGKVRRFLQKMQRGGFLQIVEAGGATVLNLVNYDQYSGQKSGTPAEQRRNTSGTPAEHLNSDKTTTYGEGGTPAEQRRNTSGTPAEHVLKKVKERRKKEKEEEREESPQGGPLSTSQSR